MRYRERPEAARDGHLRQLYEQRSRLGAVDRGRAEGARPQRPSSTSGRSARRRHRRLDGGAPRPANHVLCVVSDDYLKAPFSTWERNAALWQAAKRRTRLRPNGSSSSRSGCRSSSIIMRRCELFGVPRRRGARKRCRKFSPSARRAEWCLLSRPERALFQHPDRRPRAFPRPRRRARRDRGGAQAPRRPGRDHGAAWAARRRQDDARGGLCGAPSRRISRDLVDQGADRGLDARRSRRARRAARLGRSRTRRRSRRSPR